MPSARTPAAHDLSIDALITGWKADVQITPAFPVPRNGRNHALQLQGEFTQPVRQVKSFALSLWSARDDDLPGARPSIGHFVKVKDRWSGSAFLALSDLDALLALACAGRLLYCNVGLLARGRDVAITHLWISTEVPEDVPTKGNR